MKCYYVYILTNQNHTVLYVGFTDDIVRRVQEHRKKINEGFTKLYNVSKLLYFEKHITCDEAIKREKQLKKWNRQWKENLINKINPEWKDLSDEFKKVAPLEVLELLFKININ
jgi:putative endonuclease